MDPVTDRDCLHLVRYVGGKTGLYIFFFGLFVSLVLEPTDGTNRDSKVVRSKRYRQES